MVGWFIFDEVRVVAPHEVDTLLLLALLYIRAGMASQGHMGRDMMGYAQQTAVIHVVSQLLHLLNGASTLHGHNVVTVNARRYDALLHALLA